MLLQQLVIYPIKSAQGIVVDEMPVDISGPPDDRRWMLVDQNGAQLTQRDLPAMAFLKTRFEGESLVVEAPGMPALSIPRQLPPGESIAVRIWDDDLLLPHLGAQFDEWLSTFLKRDCKLVHLPAEVIRPVEPPFNQPPWRVSLADAYPLLVLSQASLELLNTRTPEPMSMNRFRPNLVISGTEAHEEDEWRRIRLGGVELSLVKPCARCSLTLVDPMTAERGLEPLRTLNQYRKRGDKVMFGQNALVTKPGVLRRGSTVEVLESSAIPSVAASL